MNTKDIKRRIAELLGKSFNAFASYKTTEGTELKTEGDTFEVGQNIYVITPQGELPAEDGLYEMENGMKVKVKEGLVEEITDMEEVTAEETTEDEVEVEVELSEATLVDGTKVVTDGDFEVGKPLFVITEAGEKVMCPPGEHTTESGIVLVVNAEGVLTGVKQPGETPEGSLEASTEALLNEFVSVVKSLQTELNELKKTNKELTEKFSKFSAEPAAERHFDRKGYFNEVNANKFSKLEALAQLKKNKK